MGPPITGCVARVEPTQHHRRFVNEVKPPWVMMKLHHARRLANKGGYTAESWAGEGVDVITTSTINDDQLDRISWVEERDVIRAFEPAYHIPTDVSVYRTQPLDDRVECIENHLTGVAWIQSELTDTQTSVIPLFKGYTHSERELCLSATSALETDMVALYATRYFTGESGKAHNELFRDLQRYTKHDMPPTLIIGLLAPNYLERVPEYVVAASGQHQWRKRCLADPKSVEQQRATYQGLSDLVEDALSLDATPNTKPPVEATSNTPSVESKGD